MVRWRSSTRESESVNSQLENDKFSNDSSKIAESFSLERANDYETHPSAVEI